MKFDSLKLLFFSTLLLTLSSGILCSLTAVPFVGDGQGMKEEQRQMKTLILLIITALLTFSLPARASTLLAFTPKGNIPAGYACDVLSYFSPGLGECHTNATKNDYPYFAFTHYSSSSTDAMCWGCFKSFSQPPALKNYCYCRSKRESEGWHHVRGWVIIKVTTYPDGREFESQPFDGYFASYDSCQEMMPGESYCQ